MDLIQDRVLLQTHSLREQLRVKAHLLLTLTVTTDVFLLTTLCKKNIIFLLQHQETLRGLFFYALDLNICTHIRTLLMTHYTVGYLDQSRHHQEVCITAEDSWDARRIAQEDVSWIHDHPNAVDCIMPEGSLFGNV